MPNNQSSKDDDEHDWITLSGCNQISQWKFPPNKTNCPVQKCRAQFEDRAQTILHYKTVHAEHGVLCPLCNKPIIAKLTVTYKRHFMSLHPGEKFPLDEIDRIEEIDDTSGIDEPAAIHPSDLTVLSQLLIYIPWEKSFKPKSWIFSFPKSPKSHLCKKA